MADGAAEPGRVAPRLRLCHGCQQFVRPGQPTCRFCGGDLDALAAQDQRRRAAIREAADALRDALAVRRS